MPQHSIFGPDVHPSRLVIELEERDHHEGGGIVVTLKAATPTRPLTTYDVYALTGYQADYLGTLLERLGMSYLTAERIADLRRIFTRTVREARRHDAKMTL